MWYMCHQNLKSSKSIVNADTHQSIDEENSLKESKHFDLCEPLDSPIQLNERFRLVMRLFDLMLLLLLRLMQLNPLNGNE
ncbi:CLUMA_CG015652, isoform A [Clunio marinus]|uniref:CLUMA_CG015652, isoform A n=1 Tax=Clunio marinus TaxID=568069 RepID=A0A1J1IQ40_9DIPT|nr:CLUMA_CG015652, isoform A [Clunio marinus]